jgi:hypothetical protein
MLICGDPLLGTFHHRIASIFLSLRWVRSGPDSQFIQFLQGELFQIRSSVWSKRPAGFAPPETFLTIEERLQQ